MTIMNLVKMARVLQKGRKDCEEKRRNCLLQAFSHFSQSVFKRFVLQTCKDEGLFGKGLNGSSHQLNSPIKQTCISKTLKKIAFENIIGKGENVDYKHFLLLTSLSKTNPII